MAYRDLREFVARLDAAGELVRIKASVSAQLEISAIVDRVSKGPAGQNRALLFENVRGYDVPVLINAFGSARRMAWALGVEDLNELAANLGALVKPELPQGLGPMLNKAGEFWDALRSVGLGPHLVSHAPVQEVVSTGEQATLDGLPILQCWPKDGGRYITLPTVITRDPESGGRNVGMYRLQMYDNHTLGMHWQIHKGGA
ncbi:MAG TPA: UbiD family decarboxylase domain-containing protein, partial [Anaerolineae bacterium]